MTDKQAPASRRPIQGVTAVVAAAFLLVGVLGFIPGITTHYGELTFAGPHSGARLFGVFGVSALHNIVHLLFGIVGLAATRRSGSARAFLMIGGLVYLLLWVYGAATDDHSQADFVPLDHADDWLHFGLGAGMIVLGVLLTALERARGQYPPTRRHVGNPQDSHG
ncbi:DUF4383 domain-containing protein [Amycolatopsis sp. NPDC051372]|uniref:DUF4383 domain-containing protein n=1 Tax=unclassified Amycolatopsis TaxID=2618356 RepID=UPI00342B7AD8